MKSARQEKQKGAVLAEFSLGIGLFLGLIFTCGYICFYLYRLCALHFTVAMAYRYGIIDAYTNNALSPRAYISARLNNPPPGFVPISNVRMCPINAMDPSCPDGTLAQGQVFAIRVEGQADSFARVLGLSYVVWVIGVNANPVSVEPVV
jgi:hypothetical protein